VIFTGKSRFFLLLCGFNLEELGVRGPHYNVLVEAVSSALDMAATDSIATGSSKAGLLLALLLFCKATAVSDGIAKSLEVLFLATMPATDGFFK